MIQFQGGGYRYPDLTLILAAVAVGVAAAVFAGAWYAGCPLSVTRLAGLFSGLLGTALLGSAFTPAGLMPPQGSPRARVRWCLERRGGVTVEFTPWAFYGSLLLLAVAVVLGAVA